MPRPVAAGCGCTDRFPNEAALVDALRARDLSLVAGPPAGPRTVLAEFEAPHRRPDLVVVDVDEPVVAARAAAGVGSLADVPAATKVAVAFSARDDTVVTSAELDVLARSAGLSRAHVVGSVLPVLVERGWVARRSRTSWQLAHRWVPPVVACTPIEAKLSFTKAAVRQAQCQLLWAGAAWVAVDASRWRDRAEWPALWQFGIVTLCAGCAQLRVPRPLADDRRPPSPVYAAQAAESALARIAAGDLDGADHLVFGRTLTAAGASARVAGRARPDGRLWDGRARAWQPAISVRGRLVPAAADPVSGRWFPAADRPAPPVPDGPAVGDDVRGGPTRAR